MRFLLLDFYPTHQTCFIQNLEPLGQEALVFYPIDLMYFCPYNALGILVTIISVTGCFFRYF